MSADWWNESGLTPAARERLSALADGEMHSDEVSQVVGAMRTDDRMQAGVCETWHAYQLIGDAMRSADLAKSSRDDLFLARLRERMAQEPIVLAPQPVPPVQELPAEPAVAVAAGAAVAVRRRTWVSPLAAAAGVMAVAGVLVVTRMSQETVQPGAPVSTLAQSVPAAAPQLVAAQAGAAAATAEQRVETASGTLLRDARLDRYLAAHKQFGGSSALGVPSGFLRSSTYDGPNR